MYICIHVCIFVFILTLPGPFYVDNLAKSPNAKHTPLLVWGL